MSTVLQSLNAALQRAMQVDDRVIIMGEDILDPYGGAFKVTQGLSTAFPERVWSSPISEAGIVGLGAGMALRGLRPVVEIMFGDFITLAADQLVNHIAKFRWMYNDQVRVPVVIRLPMGGRRGYGPTHSQTLEKLFLGIPGLKVVTPCALQAANAQIANEQANAGKLLLDAIADDDPVIFIENKLLYLSKLQNAETLPDFEIVLQTQSTTYYPTYKLTIKGVPRANITLAAYGYVAELVRDAALKLAYENEIFSELIVPTQLAPFDIAIQPILDSVKQTQNLLVIEEGTRSMGWGAEVVARVSESLGEKLKAVQRVAAEEVPVPASLVLEKSALPGIEDILETAQKLLA